MKFSKSAARQAWIKKKHKFQSIATYLHFHFRPKFPPDRKRMPALIKEKKEAVYPCCCCNFAVAAAKLKIENWKFPPSVARWLNRLPAVTEWQKKGINPASNYFRTKNTLKVILLAWSIETNSRTKKNPRIIWTKPSFSRISKENTS